MAEELLVNDAREIKRQIAYKCSIGELVKGVFVKKQGWESSYIMTDYGDFSRVNIIAAVVDKQENTLVFDDGTGKLTGRFFENNDQLQNIGVGDVVLIIARPREYNNSLYLALEILKRIDNRAWINYRRKELLMIKKVRNIDAVKNKPKNLEPEIVENQSTTNSKDKLLRIISQLDTGSGASIDDIITLSKITNAEEIINDMQLKGDIFEVKPGRLKLM
jgi:RPA family protein